MVKYILQRILYMIMVFFIITLMCFVLVRMLPLPVLPPEDPHTTVVLMRREALGYNEPYLTQFWLFLKNIFTNWDWGLSEKLYFGQNVWDIFVSKLPATMIVNLYSIIGSIPIGIGLGIFAALKKNTWIDYVISTLTMVVISVPSFVYAFLIQYIFCFYRPEGSQAYVEGHVGDGHSHLFNLLQQFFCKMKSCRRCRCRSVMFCIHCLITVFIF